MDHLKSTAQYTNTDQTSTLNGVSSKYVRTSDVHSGEAGEAVPPLSSFEVKKKKIAARPGFEPGSPCSKA